MYNIIPLKIPILYLIYNRASITYKTFEKIRDVKPLKLYIAADGPNRSKNNDESNCQQTRSIIEEVDWDCELKTLFRKENLGCAKAVKTAIDWFFQENEMGIIIEDDVLTCPPFFYFCEALLNKYRDDERIMMISGYNHFGTWSACNHSYLFAYYGGVWGWATWKRAWTGFDEKLKHWDSAKKNNVLKKVLHQDDELIKKREFLVENALSGKIDSWAYKWGAHRIMNNGLCVIPSKNMTENIGFEQQATHTKGKSTSQSIRVEKNLEIEHNPFIIPDRDYDLKFMEMSAVGSMEKSKKNIFLKKIIRKLRSLGKLLYTNFINKQSNSDQAQCESILPQWHLIQAGPAKGYSLYIIPSKFKGWQEMLNGEYDQFMFKNMRSSKIIWDIGAHFGYSSMCFSRLVGEEGKVIAFEPNSFNFERLKLHIVKNEISNIEICPYALFSEEKILSFNVSNDIENSPSTGSHLADILPSQPAEVYSRLGFEKIEVQAKTIDRLIECDHYAIPDCLKIDVEGAEFECIKGARSLLSQHKPLLLLEVHNIIAMHDVITYLKKFDYETEIMSPEHCSLSRAFIKAY